MAMNVYDQRCRSGLHGSSTDYADYAIDSNERIAELQAWHQFEIRRRPALSTHRELAPFPLLQSLRCCVTPSVAANTRALFRSKFGSKLYHLVTAYPKEFLAKIILSTRGLANFLAIRGEAVGQRSFGG